jgi:hypothetical protein
MKSTRGSSGSTCPVSFECARESEKTTSAAAGGWPLSGVREKETLLARTEKEKEDNVTKAITR